MRECVRAWARACVLAPPHPISLHPSSTTDHRPPTTDHRPPTTEHRTPNTNPSVSFFAFVEYFVPGGHHHRGALGLSALSWLLHGLRPPAQLGARAHQLPIQLPISLTEHQERRRHAVVAAGAVVRGLGAEVLRTEHLVVGHWLAMGRRLPNQPRQVGPPHVQADRTATATPPRRHRLASNPRRCGAMIRHAASHHMYPPPRHPPHVPPFNPSLNSSCCTALPRTAHRATAPTRARTTRST